MFHRSIPVTIAALLLVTFCIDTKASGVDESEDSIIIDAADLNKRGREERQFFTLEKKSLPGQCLTSKGEVGKCTTFKECYPYFKIPDLGILDGWVLGVYDSCSYLQSDGKAAFGICCADYQPTTPASNLESGISVENPDEEVTAVDEQSKVEVVKPRPKPTATWPPPLPTHPPHHTIPPIPTHPPSFAGATAASSTSKPPFSPSSPSSQKPTSATWPTKKPAYWPAGIPTLLPGLPSEAPLAPSKPPPTSIPTIASPIDSGYCGSKNGPQKISDSDRIVGGHSTKIGEWPWIVALFNAGRQFCGGSLIDNIHILTAAHCVVNMNSWDVARLTVRLGDHNIKTSTEVRHIERRVKRVVRHKNFNSRTLYNDVALLTLNEPVEFSEQIRPICLPSGRDLYNHQEATVIGWGSLRESGPQPAVLQQVTIKIWSNAECKVKYGAAAPGGIVDSFLCAGQAQKDSCSGDSGGPLMVNDGRWTQVGIVSWGIGCGKGQYPGVYTRVTHFLPWISKNLK
ncbi:serine protease 44-like [Leptopilina heterotoma]|uniref:serine protease 44-like n=1 Tax=Leptopilina heterotoma TaxID=63436 RepID=UPI001CA853E0|nr:serine protease 44-like [Leptopilina heterotoma]